MDANLLMFAPDGTQRSFPLTRPATVLGRQEDCDLRLALPSVSRHHCRFIIDADLVRLEDLGSANGTLVNGHKVEVMVLNPGDRIKVGPTEMFLQINGLPEAESVSPRHAVARPAPKPTPKPSQTGTPTPDEIDSILAEPDEKSPDDSGEFKLE